jgi:hypothetical protein
MRSKGFRFPRIGNFLQVFGWASRSGHRRCDIFIPTQNNRNQEKVGDLHLCPVWDLSGRRHYPSQTVAAVETTPMPEVMSCRVWMSWHERSSNDSSVKNINVSVRPETCKYDPKEWTARISIIDRMTWGKVGHDEIQHGHKLFITL